MDPGHFIPDTRFHSLGDFITAGPPESPKGKHNLGSALEICQRLGLALHPCKRVGHSTVLAVLGIALSIKLLGRKVDEALSR